MGAEQFKKSPPEVPRSMSGKNRTSPEEIRPLVYPDMSGKYGTGLNLSMGAIHSHLQSFATPPPRVAVRRREVIRHADGRGWEKMENVEFRNFPSMTSRKSYCISKIIIFETVSRWLTCDYSPRNNTMSHLLPAVIWWPSCRCICRCLLIGGKLNSIKFL